MRDDCFIRGNIPMTKSEVRAVSLSKLELQADSVVYDIGAGTGSVSVEAALSAPRGQVYAFEQRTEGCQLIRQNAEKFGVTNLTVAEGRAPEICAGFPVPDRVFIGGSDGAMEEILDWLGGLSVDGGMRVVLNVIALETLTRLLAYLQGEKGARWEAELVCVQVSRAEKLGNVHRMKAQNPVYVITLSRCPAGSE